MDLYIDQFGIEHVLDDEQKRINRSGIFALCIYNSHILLSWSPWAPELAELPGGGIEEGEKLDEALFREIEEEASVRLNQLEPSATYEQHIKYYARASDQYWDYDQVFWKIDDPELAEHFFSGERQPEDAVKAKWVHLDELETIQFHAGHKKALEALL